METPTPTTTPATYKRGSYGEIVFSSLDEATREAVRDLVNRVATADNIDEHGSWDFGAKFDAKARGSAINWDLYGFGDDVHTGRLLIVVQVRRYEKAHKNWWPSVRKNYFLCGTNEDGSVFSHPITSNVVHAAIKRKRDVVIAAENWIFDGDYTHMIRQGDLALIPCTRRPSAEKIPQRKIVLEESHQLTATSIRQNGHTYAKDPTLVHLPGTHPTISGAGWFRVVVGKRGEFWKFAAPTAD